jgi:heme exporter protein C
MVKDFINILITLGAPKHFYQLATKLYPWTLVFSFIFLSIGTYAGLYIAPADYQQGDAFRILYVHVPSAFLSLGVYTIIAICSFLYLVWKVKIADIIATCSAAVGATFTFLALATGAIWGKPMWGAWWVWDARLTSELILFFLYLGYLCLRSAVSAPSLSGKVCGIFALMGLIDIPIVHFSVGWWNTLHQGPTISRWAKPAMPWSMLWPLLTMLVGFGLFYLSVVLMRSRSELIRREQQTQWVGQLLKESSPCSMPNTFGAVIS